MSINIIPKIERKCLLLREWRATDFAYFCEMLQDPSTESAIGIPGLPTDRAAAWRSFLVIIGHWQLNGFGEWAICKSGCGTLVGYTGFWYPAGASCVEISWCIHPAFRQQGIAKTAAKMALEYWIKNTPDRLTNTPVVANIAEENKPSERVAQALGMSRAEAVSNPFKPHYNWRLKG